MGISGDDPSDRCVARVGVAAMGCLFEAIVWGDDADWCAGVAREALGVVEDLDQQLSHYKSTSDITRLNAWASHSPVRVEPGLFGLLSQCAEWTRITGGAFDVAVGALLDCWGFHTGAGRVAGAEEISEAMSRSGMAHVALEPETDLVHFLRPGIRLNLGAVGKGYALDCAAELLRRYGVTRALLHGGLSTILAVGTAPDPDVRRLTVRNPVGGQFLATVEIADNALATSGAYHQFVEAEGVRYGHIIDPRTGWPSDTVITVSVVARSAAAADALSTALFILGPEAGCDLQRDGHIDGFTMLSRGDGGDLIVTSAGLP